MALRSRPALTAWVAVITASAFGPYVHAVGPYVLEGVRTEQLIVYLSAAVVLAFFVPCIIESTAAPLPFILVWGGLLAVAAIGAAWPTLNLTGYSSGTVAAGLDNFALPLAVMLLTWFWVSVLDRRVLLRVVCLVIVILMTVNAVIAIWSAYRGATNSLGWLPSFWSSSDESVAALVLGSGRFTGVFNSPVEAGFTYSLALFCLFYLLSVNRSRSARKLVPGILLAVGGILTVSKLFFLVGLPLAIFLVFWQHRRRLRIFVTAGVVGAGVWLLSATGSFPQWLGAGTISRLFAAKGGGAARALTAGRLGDRGTLLPVARTVLRSNPGFGLGAGGLRVPYDSTWLEALATAGLFGVILNGVIFLMLVKRWLSVRGNMPRPACLLAGTTITLALFGSLGFPSLTANRTSTLVWLILGLTVVTFPLSRDEVGMRSLDSGRDGPEPVRQSSAPSGDTRQL